MLISEILRLVVLTQKAGCPLCALLEREGNHFFKCVTYQVMFLSLRNWKGEKGRGRTDIQATVLHCTDTVLGRSTRILNSQELASQLYFSILPTFIYAWSCYFAEMNA